MAISDLVCGGERRIFRCRGRGGRGSLAAQYRFVGVAFGVVRFSHVAAAPRISVFVRGDSVLDFAVGGFLRALFRWQAPAQNFAADSARGGGGVVCFCRRDGRAESAAVARGAARRRVCGAFGRSVALDLRGVVGGNRHCRLCARSRSAVRILPPHRRGRRSRRRVAMGAFLRANRRLLLFASAGSVLRPSRGVGESFAFCGGRICESHYRAGRFARQASCVERRAADFGGGRRRLSYFAGADAAGGRSGNFGFLDGKRSVADRGIRAHRIERRLGALAADEEARTKPSTTKRPWRDYRLVAVPQGQHENLTQIFGDDLPQPPRKFYGIDFAEESAAE